MAAKDGRPAEDVVVDPEPTEIADPLASLVTGDHPDPVTLGTPEIDDQGLLRWASLPA